MQLSCSAMAILLIALSLGLFQLTGARSLVPRDDAAFDWANLASSINLSWTPCYDTFQCARFTVPLQYSNVSAGEAQIAMVMSPSSFKPGDENYLGPILFNPGGPGGSGNGFILQLAPYFRAIIGPKYDLVGFDPRGVGATTPALAVFNSPPEALAFYSGFPQNANESTSSLGRFYTEMQIMANLVLDRAKVVAESVSTAAVARDMLAITKAFGFDKLNYWGVSYGSVLGASYAAMYPHNVGHLILDGVINSHDWYAGNWSSSFFDSDNALVSFYQACFEAGPSLCAIYENSTDLISARVDKIINGVHLRPIQVYNDQDPSSINFGVVDYTVAMGQLIQAVHAPFGQGASIARGLVQLEQGNNGSLIFAGSGASEVNSLDTCDFDSSQPFVAGFVETSSAINCGDILVDNIRTFEQVQSDYEEMLKVTRLATGMYTLTQGPCATWPVTGKDCFSGSFNTNTSSPILLIGNTFDPVTSFAGAQNMSAGFENSALLQQNSTGHTSLSGFSTCTALVIQAYFANGTLPAPGTICQTDTEIFESPTNSSGYGGVNFTLPNSRRGEQAYTLQDAANALARSNFLARNSLISRMMGRSSDLSW